MITWKTEFCGEDILHIVTEYRNAFGCGNALGGGADALIEFCERHRVKYMTLAEWDLRFRGRSAAEIQAVLDAEQEIAWIRKVSPRLASLLRKSRRDLAWIGILGSTITLFDQLPLRKCQTLQAAVYYWTYYTREFWKALFSLGQGDLPLWLGPFLNMTVFLLLTAVATRTPTRYPVEHSFFHPLGGVGMAYVGPIIVAIYLIPSGSALDDAMKIDKSLEYKVAVAQVLPITALWYGYFSCGDAKYLNRLWAILFCVAVLVLANAAIVELAL